MKTKSPHPMLSNRLGLSLLLLAALLAPAPGLAAETAPPTIDSFAITPITEGAKGAEGNWFEISWTTEGADRVRLYKNGQELPGRQRMADGAAGWPLSLPRGLSSQIRTAAVYELVASNAEGQVSEIVEVEIAAAVEPTSPDGPRILSFEIRPQSIEPGGSVQFYWEIEGADLVRLSDEQGELESRIVLANGRFGWPLSMNGALQESLDRTTTFELTALTKTGRVSESVEVTVGGDAATAEEPQRPDKVVVVDEPDQTAQNCRVTVWIRGKYAGSTDTVAVFGEKAGGVGDFLFKRPVTAVQARGASRGAATTQRAIISLPEGRYRLVPSGGGEDSAGPFAVIYQPRNGPFTCSDGGSGSLGFKAEFAEY